MYKCYFCNKQFKETSNYEVHMEKNLCTFISNTPDIEIKSILYYLNQKKHTRNSIKLTYSKNT
jgi:hypothetical protein